MARKSLSAARRGAFNSIVNLALQQTKESRLVALTTSPTVRIERFWQDAKASLLRCVQFSSVQFTTWITALDVLVAEAASPSYFTVIECEPTARPDVVKLATPSDRVPVPMAEEPSMNVTVPVGEAPVTVAVKVTG